MSNEYGADSVQILNPIEAIRKRASMYIGRTDEHGLHHLMKEIVDNAIDEAMGGFCDKVIVRIHPDNSLSVEDNGRGIPVGLNKDGLEVLQVMFSTTHSGGKFDNKSYENSGGLHGVGTVVVNALSLWTHITSYKHGVQYELKFNERETEGLKEISKTKKHGTVVRFKPDPEIFTTVVWDYVTIYNILKEKAYLNKGLTIEFIDERSNDEERFQKDNGIIDMMTDITSDKNNITDIFYMEDKKKGIDTKIELVLRFMNNADEIDKSYANGIPTTQGGTHTDATRRALRDAINGIGIKAKLINKNEPLRVQDIKDGLAMILCVKYPELAFESQTKEKLAVNQIGADIKVLLVNLDKKLAALPNINQAIERLVKLRDMKEHTKAAKVVNGKVSDVRLPDKLTDCKYDEPAMSELFLVEGESAGGTAINARNKNTQAILALRGKVSNFAKKKGIQDLYNDSSVQDIVKSLGCGVGPNLDLNKLRYHKIKIMTDADIDGAHILALLLNFFFMFMKPLLIHGHIYIVLAPLFRVETTRDKRSFYIWNKSDLVTMTNQLDEKGVNYHVQRYKGLGEMDAHELRDTSMNPETSKLVRVKLNPDENIDDFMKGVFADDASYRKQMIDEFIEMRKKA
jgi:DNA gyrase/topoisomerase IV subunit B